MTVTIPKFPPLPPKFANLLPEEVRTLRRCVILNILRAHPDESYSDLAEKFGLPTGTLSSYAHHLKTLPDGVRAKILGKRDRRRGNQPRIKNRVANRHNETPRRQVTIERDDLEGAIAAAILKHVPDIAKTVAEVARYAMADDIVDKVKEVLNGRS